MIDENKLIERFKQLKGVDSLANMFISDVIRVIKKQPKIGEWIPADKPPKDDNYILLSFENFSLPLVGRYEKDEEGGAYYVGDCDGEDSCVANDFLVNAWMPLPEPFRPGKEINHDNR